MSAVLDARKQYLTAAAAALVALALPATASAHPGVYTLSAKLAAAGCTFAAFPDGSCLTNETQYAVANDGYPKAFRENNGVTGVAGDGTAGVINYKSNPGTYRGPMTPEQKRTYGPAQTDLQPHATCSGVAALASSANILAWQGNDPFFNYVPWQKISAGLGDDPAEWIPVVQTATGVNLSSLSSAADFTSACTGLGGTYRAADAAQSSISNAIVADAIAPIQAQLDAVSAENAALKGEGAGKDSENGSLRGQLAAAQQGLADAEASIQALKKKLRKARRSR